MFPKKFKLAVDLGINSVESDNSESTGNSSNFIVEMALVCDKEFSDVFRHDRQKILDYWTVFLWDLAMRYRTLFSVTISFRITSVTVFDVRFFKDPIVLEYSKIIFGPEMFVLHIFVLIADLR